MSILLIDLKNNHEYFSHKYNVSNKIRENLALLGNKFKISRDDKEFFKNNLKNNLYALGKKNLKILFSLNLLDKKKISNQDLSFFQTVEKTLIPQFPFDGKYLINKKGVQEGKNIGKILNEAD